MSDQLREYCVRDIVKLLEILMNDGLNWNVDEMHQTIRIVDEDGGRPLYEISGGGWRKL